MGTGGFFHSTAPLISFNHFGEKLPAKTQQSGAVVECNTHAHKTFVLAVLHLSERWLKWRPITVGDGGSVLRKWRRR